jgi:hypothetical protein
MLNKLQFLDLPTLQLRLQNKKAELERGATAKISYEYLNELSEELKSLQAESNARMIKRGFGGTA